MCKFNVGDFVISTDKWVSGTFGKKGVISDINKHHNGINITVCLENGTSCLIFKHNLVLDVVKNRDKKIDSILNNIG
jgi:hypothetical protein